MGHILLLFPHSGRKRPQDTILPLSLLYVAAPLLRDGHEVTAIDQRVEPEWQEKVRRALQRPRTLAVGISSMTGPQITHGIELAQFVRQTAPSLPIVWGGVHPSLLPEQTARSRLVDIVAMGEGEACFPALVNALDKGIDWGSLPGVCYEKGGQVIRNPLPPPPDLETLPPLPYELFDLEPYRTSPLRSAGRSLPLVTSRGCQSRCAYCYVEQFHQRKWRGLSPERVLADMERLVGEFKSEGIFLLDDNFFFDSYRAERILEMIVERRLNVRLFNANCRANLLYAMSEKELDLMRRAGIEQLFVGVESGSPRLLDTMHKDIRVEQVIEVNHKLRDSGIVPVYSFMAGLPDETTADVEATLDLMIRLKQENPAAKMYKMSLFVPFPGTEYYHRCLADGCAFPQHLEDWGTYDYDHTNLAYLPQEFRRYLERVSELSGFIDVDGKMPGPLHPLVRCYSKVAVWRCKKRYFEWMPELLGIRLVRKLEQV